MAEKIGLGRCPICGGEQARVSVSKNKLAVMTCTAADCGAQIFARGEGADEKLRDRIVTRAAAPAPAAIEAKPAAPAPAPAAPAPRKFSWGYLGAAA